MLGCDWRRETSNSYHMLVPDYVHCVLGTDSCSFVAAVDAVVVRASFRVDRSLSGMVFAAAIGHLMLHPLK